MPVLKKLARKGHLLISLVVLSPFLVLAAIAIIIYFGTRMWFHSGRPPLLQLEEK